MIMWRQLLAIVHCIRYGHFASNGTVMLLFWKQKSSIDSSLRLFCIFNSGAHALRFDWKNSVEFVEQYEFHEQVNYGVCRVRDPQPRSAVFIFSVQLELEECSCDTTIWLNNNRMPNIFIVSCTIWPGPIHVLMHCSPQPRHVKRRIN